MFRRGDFVAFCGYLGAGKTMTAYLLAEHYHRAGWPIVSNVDSDHFNVRYTRARTYSDIFLKPYNSVIILDELGILLDARSFAGEVNKEATKLLYLMRKHGNIVFYTVQALGFADTRIRQLTRYIFFCEATAPGYSIGRFCIYDGLDTATQRSNIVVEHRRYWHLYNSFDDQVALVDDISPPKSSRNREREYSPAPEAPPSGALGADSSQRRVIR